jgi:hypothetical protein
MSQAKLPELASTGPRRRQLAGLIKAASVDTSGQSTRNPGAVLDKLLDRQKRASLPVLYGQHPGEIEAGPRIKAGVSEVLDEGQEVVVLFSAVNPGEPCDRDSAATGSAWRQGQEKVDHRGAVARNRFPIEHTAFGRGAAGGWSCGF